MKLQSISSLFPDVRMTSDRGVFAVKSRSGDGERKVDKEKRGGLGLCDCPDARYNSNMDCWHMRRVNAMLACALIRQQMESELAR